MLELGSHPEFQGEAQPRATRLAAIAAAMVSGPRPPQPLTQVAAVLQAEAVIIMLRQGEQLEPVWSTGSAPPASNLSPLNIMTSGVFSEVVEACAPVVADARGTTLLKRRWGWSCDASLVLIPISGRQERRARGLVAYWLPAHIALDPGETALVQLIQRQLYADLAGARDEPGRGQHSSRRTAALWSRMTRPPDVKAVLSAISDIVVPYQADWCVVQQLTRGRPEPAAISHKDPGRARKLREWWAKSDPGTTIREAAQVAQDGRPRLVEQVSSGQLVCDPVSPDAETQSVPEPASSALFVPLVTDNEIGGVLAIVHGDSTREFTADNVTEAMQVAELGAAALSATQGFTESHDLAVAMREVILPRILPWVPGWRALSWSHQAGQADAGGDFYDVVALSHRRLFTVMGDVEGHGADSILAAARLRGAIRVLISQDARPAMVAAGMDKLMSVEETDLTATAVFALFDPASGGIDITVAGHPAPLLIPREGRTRFVTSGRSPMLGLQPVSRPSARLGFGVGDSILLFTDGLVESRQQPITVGLERLRAAAETHLAEPLRGAAESNDVAEALAATVEAVRSLPFDDDIAVTLLQRLAPDDLRGTTSAELT